MAACSASADRVGGCGIEGGLVAGCAGVRGVVLCAADCRVGGCGVLGGLAVVLDRAGQ
ncbi:hypothetical protein [Streptomyces sp. NPDC059668]|uniref:hypothetical protein n=1 Tax=Streptomyces sp. NPDC059668 TaxID=3346900 RepID=UPI0036CC32FE